MNKRKVPKLRFKGFTDDWEQRKLGEVFEEYSEKNHEELPALTIIQGGGTILREESDRALQYDKSSLSNYKMVKKDDFIVHLRSFEGGLEKANTDGIISPAYHTFHGDNTDSRFYYPFFRSRRFIDVLLKPHVYGIRDGKSIDIEGMKSIMIPVPSYNEQKAIGGYIETLDNLITLHQRKLDKLKIIKKSMLENCFPQNGEKVPKFRFDGFSGDWEQRKVSDITTSYSGGTPQAGNAEYYNGDIPFIRSGEIYGDHTELFITQKGMDNSSAKMVSKGDILYALYGATSGEVSRAGLDGAINQAILAIIPNENYNADFLVEWFRKEKANIIDKYLQGGQGNLSAQIIKSLDISIPSYEEQNKIGNFFSGINNLITLHQRKLEKLKAIKKSMLESMFV